jgi:uncharacterized protein (TIGR03435 family)
MRKKLALAVLTAAGWSAQAAQISAAEFEVASVKPSPSGGSVTMIGPAPGGERYEATRVTLKTMIQTAYRVRADQINGGPEWIGRDRFDIEAKAARASTAEELREMLKDLLKRRFQLQLRSETKVLPVYVLGVDSGTPKLMPHKAERTGDARVDITVLRPLHLKITGISASMDFFAYRMGYLLDRPMMNQTGIAGDFDFSLEYTREAPASMQPGVISHAGAPIDFSGPTIFTALREQMGLRLAEGKAPVEVLTILHAEKPAEN